MPLNPSWHDIALRLLLTMIAGAVIGFDRGARGHSAGLRTTILVGLAASVAMIQANLLLSVGGKAHDSFGVMDLMRLPLGILTGVGFLGGGAILRHGQAVRGLTTAATLWSVTVIGLCFGGDQIGLGSAATVLALLTLSVLKWLEMRIPREQHATLVVRGEAGMSPEALTAVLATAGYVAQIHFQREDTEGDGVLLGYDLRWRRSTVAGPPLDLLQLMNDQFRVTSFEYIPASAE